MQTNEARRRRLKVSVSGAADGALVLLSLKNAASKTGCCNIDAAEGTAQVRAVPNATCISEQPVLLAACF